MILVKAFADGDCDYITAEPRGESESYLALMFVRYSAKGRRVWFEGVRRNLANMDEPYLSAVESLLGA